MENDTTFLFVHEYLIGSDTNRYKVFIRKGPQPNDIPNFASLSPQNESAWKDFTALLHTLNHSLFKSLLFFGAGNILSQTHTTSLDALGGLAKHMPLTAILFLSLIHI